jgi:hypothetical protein
MVFKKFEEIPRFGKHVSYTLWFFNVAMENG